MAEAQYAHNHTIDPETGFLENPAYAHDFDAAKKKTFLEVFKTQGLGLYRTCRALGMSTSTIHKHYQIDPKFKEAFDDARTEYTDELEATSRVNALNPKSVIERIFQLKALLPEKYGEQKTPSNLKIEINLGSGILEHIKQRQEAIEGELIKEDLNVKAVENQSK